MKATPYTFVLLLLSSAAMGAPFCALTGVGANCLYFDMQSCRLAAGPGGTCFVNPTEVQPDTASRQRSPQFNRGNAAIESYNRGTRERAQERPMTKNGNYGSSK